MGQIELGDLETKLLTQPLEYAVLRPPAGAADRLLLLLHGGGGSRDFLTTAQRWIEQAWDDATLPACVVVAPSVTRSFYMNFRDGSERWEDAVVGPLLEHATATYGVSGRRDDIALCGPSMGGMGGLRIAFKHPDMIGAVLSLEPGIEPALSFHDIELRDRFWRDDELFKKIYGDPVDDEYWKANNPANIALADPERLRASGLAIYLECGDMDSFGLDRGTEYLHRVLYDNAIPHEYRLVRGADHTGATLPGRFADAFAFLARTWEPPAPDPSLAQLHMMINRWRTAAGLEPLTT